MSNTPQSSCESVREEIASLAVGAALPPEAQRHLLGCDECRLYSAEMDAVSKRIEAAYVPAPPELYTSVARALHARPAGNPDRRLALAIAALIAAIAAAIISWYLTMTPRIDPGGGHLPATGVTAPDEQSHLLDQDRSSLR